MDPTLVDAIQHVPVPAFAASAGRLLVVNAPGRAWLTAMPDRSTTLVRPGGPDPEIFRVTASNDRQHEVFLAILRRPIAVPMTIEAAAWGLSRNEHDVADALARGISHAQIARELGCSEQAVEQHVRHILEKAVATARVARRALDEVLEVIARPAIVIGPRGDVAHANLAARRWIEIDPSAAMKALGVRGRSRMLKAIPFATGTTRGELVIATGTTDTCARLAVASRRWGLTPRQSQVLELLSNGFSNARIAAQLGCAEATIEIHVSRIFERAGVESRASLLATLLWSSAA